MLPLRGQSGPGSDGNEGVLCIPQSSSNVGTSQWDCLVSYPGHSFGGSYPSAEKQSEYSTAPHPKKKIERVWKGVGGVGENVKETKRKIVKEWHHKHETWQKISNISKEVKNPLASWESKEQMRIWRPFAEKTGKKLSHALYDTLTLKNPHST